MRGNLKMNKEELLNLLDSLEIPKTEYYILSSGAMLLYGLREIAGDLDLCVSNELFEQLKERYNLKESDKSQYGFYHISKDIEIIPKSKENFKMKYKDGYPVEDLRTILAFKERRNKPKDQKDIENIKRYYCKFSHDFV
jgi:hypothetical protein